MTPHVLDCYLLTTMGKISETGPFENKETYQRLHGVDAVLELRWSDKLSFVAPRNVLGTRVGTVSTAGGRK